MRRLLHFLALALLVLIGPAEVVSTFTGPVNVACQCGCGATSEALCGCGATPMAPGAGPGSNQPSGTPCSTSHTGGGYTAASSPPIQIVEATQGETDAQPRLEPRPWPVTTSLRDPRVSSRLALRDGPDDALRPLDRLAQLGVFRI
jgi:hypothetical protein